MHIKAVCRCEVTSAVLTFRLQNGYIFNFWFATQPITQVPDAKNMELRTFTQLLQRDEEMQQLLSVYLILLVALGPMVY
jgi:hypothetical protein